MSEKKEKEVEVLSTFTVISRDYWDGIDYFLNRYESYPDPIDDVRKYYDEEGNAMVIVIMTPIGDLWTFEITKKSNGNYLVHLIGNSELLEEKWREKV